MTELWDRRFLELAKLISTWSKDPSSQVGAVIVSPDKRIVSVGYNGLPAKIKDGHEHPYCTWNTDGTTTKHEPDKCEYLTNRELKMRVIIHAEKNAVLFAQRSLTNHTLYTYPFMCCPQCASFVIQSGITRCVAPELKPSSEKYERWNPEFEISKTIFKEAGVNLELYDGV
jgi:dCMP deaminase